MCNMLSIALAIGVPSGVMRCRCAFNFPDAWPARNKGQLVIVDVRVAHRRSVDHQAVIEKRAVTVRRALQLFDEIRNQADVVADLVELQDAIFALLMVRRRVEARIDAALQVDAPELSRLILNENTRVTSDARATACKSNISHLLFEVVGHPLALRAAHALRRCDCALRPAECVARSPASSRCFVEAGAVRRAERRANAGDLRHDPIEHAAIGVPLCRTFFRRSAEAKLVERGARSRTMGSGSVALAQLMVSV